ncbi:hypothetical protein JL722_3819 [Aureococcus anophagefferens]|nr:hypothetical protein JL722_3819 [Aureococcus anophagefferens]
MENNRLNGSLPSDLFASPYLEELEFYGNELSGDLACPETEELLLEVLDLEKNKFTGPVPACYFSDLPKLRLVYFSAERAGLTGELPASLTGCRSLAFFLVSHNFLSGEITSDFVNAFPEMYHIDLDYNAFSGELPYLSCCLKNLHKVSFEHNAFTGSVTDDHFIERAAAPRRGRRGLYAGFAMGQKPSVESALSLVGNRLSGPLPSIFSFYYDAATTLTYFSAKDNHFRCSARPAPAVPGRATPPRAGPDHENEYFEDWAHNLAEDVGMCEPVATPGAARAGDEITVAGEAFAATTESTCKFTYDAGGSDVVPAFFYSAAEVRCTLPEDAPTGDCVVAVANYGDDYSDATTLGDYAAVTFEIYPPESSKKKSDDTTAILARARRRESSPFERPARRGASPPRRAAAAVPIYARSSLATAPRRRRSRSSSPRSSSPRS